MLGNPNTIRIRGKQFPCYKVDESMSTEAFQGGLITDASSESHPLYGKEGDFLVVYNNTLYYALSEEMGESSPKQMVRMYDVTTDSGSVDDIDTNTTPGFVIMSMRDLSVDANDNSFIRWRYINSGSERQSTMNFRVNYVDTLPSVSEDIKGQIFWSMLDTTDTTSGEVTYEAGVWMCEDVRFVRLDFEENSPSFLRKMVKDMKIVTNETDNNRYLQLISYQDTVIAEINAEDWYKHIDIPLVEKPTAIDASEEYIPSDLSAYSIMSGITRDSYGHVVAYSVLNKVNTRYKWEEIK